MKNKLVSPRVKSIDALRVFAILGVVLIHTTTRTLEASHFDLNNYWFSLFLNQSARFAAPLFFMISGFVLELGFDNHKHIFSYLKSRFTKIFIPYLFWSFVYYTFVYTNNPESFTKALLTGSSSYQLYFIPTLAIFYLIFPFLHKIKRVLVNKWILLILFVSQALVLNYDYFIKPLPYAFPVKTTMFSYFSFILGMAASSYKDRMLNFVSKTKHVLIPIVAYLAYFIFDEGKRKYLETTNYLTFYSQWRVDILIYTILVAVLLFSLIEKSSFQQRVVDKVSKLSFFVFFVHVIVLETVWKYIGLNLFNLTSNNFYGKILFEPIYFMIVLGISLLLGYFVHKIPKLTKITG